MAKHENTIAALQSEIERLQEREKLYHTLYTAMLEGVALHEIVTDETGTPIDYRIREVNPAFEAITGLSYANVVGRLASDLYGTGEPPYLDNYAQVVATGEPYMFETTFDAMQKTFRICALPTAPGQFATIFNDITTQQDTEAALRESEMRYRVVSELTSDFAFALRIEPDGSPVPEWITDAFTRITGLTKEEARDPEKMRSITYADDIPRLTEHQARVLAGNDVGIIEFRIVRQGEVRWLRHYFKPVWDEQAGRVVRIYGAAQDITERKRAEEALRENETRYREITELISDAVYSARWTADGTIVAEWGSETFEKIMGHSLAKINPAYWITLIYSDDKPIMQQRMERLYANQTSIDEYRIVRSDGEIRWIRDHARPVWNDTTNRLERVYGAVHDITQQKLAEEAVSIFKALIENATDGILLKNLDLTIEYINAAAACLFEVPLDELVGQDAAWFVTPEEQHRVQDEIVPALQQHNHWQSEIWLRRRDGTRWISQVSMFVLPDAAGQSRHLASIFRDVTSQRNLRERLQLTQFALDHAPECVAFLNEAGEHLYVNHAVCQVLGYTAEELRNMHICDIARDLSAEDWQAIWQIAQQQGSHFFEGRYYCKDGSSFLVEVASTYLQFDGLAYLCSFARNISMYYAYKQEIERLAFSDPLTGLANRRHLYEVGEAALAESPEDTALLYLDLDRFKAFNDTLGHDAGDHLLVQVTRRLQQCVGAAGLLARIGGDEFAVLVKDVADTEAVVALAQQLLNALCQPFELSTLRVYLNGSIGIAFGSLGIQGFSTLLTRADIAMYRSKRHQNGIEVYDPSHGILASDQMYFEAEFRQTLAAGMLSLHYQPIVDIETEQLFGVEALVRWPHPTHGLLSPGRFLPLAEEIGLLGTLDFWVLQTALAQVAAWQAAGTPCTVTVNLSAHSFRRVDLVEHIATLLAANGVAPEYLVVELTEHTALHDLPLTYQVLTDLQALGVRIALDDFGTGYASLTHLRELPVDILKIERVFVAGVGHNPRDEAVLRALLALGAGLDMIIITEGVEEDPQLAWLQAEGGRYIQGYLMGRPVAAHELQLYR